MSRPRRAAALLPVARRTLLVVAPLALLFTACRPEERTDEPPEVVQETPDQAAATAPDVVGTYRLTAVNDEPLPGQAGQVDECALELTQGVLRLGPDARYALDLLARAVCDDGSEAQVIDRAMKEGPYAVAGFEVRFGDETPLAGQAGEPEAADATEEDLFDTGRFSGSGTLRDSVLTVRLSDELTTFTFVRE